MTSINVGGISLTLNAAATAGKILSGVAIKKEDRHDSSVSKYDLNKLKYRIVAEDQLKDGKLLDLVAVTDRTSIDEVYDATQILSQIRSHFKQVDMLTTFTIVIPIKNAAGDILGQIPTDTFDLFEQHGRVSYEQIRDSIDFYMKWVFQVPTTPGSGRLWVETDLTWSAQFLFNQMSPELSVAIKDDLKDKGVPEDYFEAGPIVLKALIDRMLSSNYNALKLLKEDLDRSKVSLDHFDGDIEDFAKKYTTIIQRLKQCESRDASGALIGVEHVPSNLSETILLALLTTGHTQFDLIMNSKYAKSKGDAALGVATPFDPPEQLLSEARRLFVSFRQAGDWDALQRDKQNPSGFAAGTHNQGQCFGCGRVGCRQTERTCPRFGKTALPAGIQAKDAFFEAKKKRKEGHSQKHGGDGKKKWPPKPNKSDPKRTKILGTWHYYHFKSKKWLRCDDQSDAGNQKSIDDAKAKAISNPVAEQQADVAQAHELPAGLAALIKGKEETQEVRLHRQLYLEGQKKLAEQFKAAVL